MKCKIRCLIVGILIGGMLIFPSSAVAPFPDVDETASYAEAVEYLRDIGIMKGDDRGYFNPDKTVTRAEMATIICNMLDETDGIVKTGGVFTDVPESHWASGYIAKAVERKVISGYGDGRFGPNDPVTYEQAITMMVRVIGEFDRAQASGGYPDGYIAVAQEFNILLGIEPNIGKSLIRSEIACLVLNTLIT